MKPDGCSNAWFRIGGFVWLDMKGVVLNSEWVSFHHATIIEELPLTFGVGPLYA